MLAVFCSIVGDEWEVVDDNAVEGLTIPRRAIIATVETNNTFNVTVVEVEVAILFEADFATDEADVVVVDKWNCLVHGSALVVVNAHYERTVIDDCRAGWVLCVDDSRVVVIDFAVNECEVTGGSVNDVAGDSMSIEIERNLLGVGDDFFGIDEKGNNIICNCFGLSFHNRRVELAGALDAGNNRCPFSSEANVTFDDKIRSAKLRFGAGIMPVVKEPTIASGFEHGVLGAFADLVG